MNFAHLSKTEITFTLALLNPAERLRDPNIFSLQSELLTIQDNLRRGSSKMGHVFAKLLLFLIAGNFDKSPANSILADALLI